jgi:hypothetical protein
MAAAPGATHGGKRRNSGRKRKYERSNSAQLVWNRQHKPIYLSLTVFKSWKDAKNEAGYGSSTAHLLSLEYRRRCEEFHYFLLLLLSSFGPFIENMIRIPFRSDVDVSRQRKERMQAENANANMVSNMQGKQ